MITVRMQNDVKLPPNERRNYKNAIDGLIKVYRFEGAKTLFNGASMATLRATMMTIGQVSECSSMFTIGQQLLTSSALFSPVYSCPCTIKSSTAC